MATGYWVLQQQGHELDKEFIRSMGRLGQAFGMARQRKEQEKQLKDLYAARQSYAKGDSSQLRTMAPEEYLAFEQQKSGQERNRIETQKLAEDRRAKMSRFYAQALQSAQNDPARQQAIMQGAQRNGIDLGQYLQAAPQPQDVGLAGPSADQQPVQMAPAQDVAFDLEARAAGVLGPREQQGPQFPEDEAAKRVILKSNGRLRPGLPGFDPAYQQELQALQRERLAGRRAGATQVNVGNDAVGLTSAQQSKTQEKVLNARQTLGELGMIEDSIKSAGGYDAMGDYGERASAAATEFAGKTPYLQQTVSKEDRAQIARRSEAQAMIGRFRDRLLSSISGAAISESEMRRLVQSAPNDTDYGPVLKAKLDTWRRLAEFEAQYGTDALVNGIEKGGLLDRVGAPAGKREQPTEAEMDEFWESP